MSSGTVFWWFLAAGAAVVVVLLVVVALVKVVGRGHAEDGSARDVLAERFARGEIDEEEYRRRTTVLRGDTVARGDPE